MTCLVCGIGKVSSQDDGELYYYLCDTCGAEYADAELITKNRERMES